MNNLIGVTGLKGSGKDTVAKIINTLHQKQYKTKRFANPLKRFVADILGVPVELLEDRAYKETVLSKEWDRWFIKKGQRYFVLAGTAKVFTSKKEANDFIINKLPFMGRTDERDFHVEKESITPRLLMQLIGTEVGRQIHKNICVNALFANYNEKVIEDESHYKNCKHGPYGGCERCVEIKDFDFKKQRWIIPDVRYNNEAKAIKDRGGIIIKVERDVGITDTHASEKGISDEYIDIVIDNNGSMEDLVEEVKTILYAS